jgi:hypothetical protein
MLAVVMKNLQPLTSHLYAAVTAVLLIAALAIAFAAGMP